MTEMESIGFRAQRLLGRATPTLPRSYNFAMARGWESKSVEEQQSQAAANPSPGKRRLSPEEAASRREREGILLSRKRVVRQLEDTQNPNHRKMLQEALTELDAQLARLG